MKYVQFKKWHRSNFSRIPVNMYCPSALKAVSHTHLWLSVCFSSCNKVKWSALHILAVVSADVVASKLKYKYFIKIGRKTILLVIHWPENNIWHNLKKKWGLLWDKRITTKSIIILHTYFESGLNLHFSVCLVCASNFCLGIILVGVSITPEIKLQM